MSNPDLAGLATLLVEPARAAILMHLWDGRSWTAKELARAAKIGSPAASVHLRKLLEGGLVHVTPSGRHRYFRLANQEIAGLLEQLAYFAPFSAPVVPAARRAAVQLCHCRMCYDHIAGRVGVRLTQRMIEKRWLIESEPWYHLTDDGVEGLAELDIGIAKGRTCMDWSERSLHLAGALGTRLAEALLRNRWLQREARGRALLITPLGEEQLLRIFELNVRDGRAIDQRQVIARGTTLVG